MKPILGFSGKARHGKGYCTEVVLGLAKDMGRNFIPFSFALPLKAIIIGENPDISYDDVFITKKPEVRTLLQQRGTENGRLLYGEDIWVRMAEAILSYMSNAPTIDGFVIDDCRFPNEAAMISKYGKCLRILSNRPTLEGDAALHSSETALDDYKNFDGYVSNNLHDNNWDLTNQLVGPVHSLIFGSK